MFVDLPVPEAIHPAGRYIINDDATGHIGEIT